MDLDKKVATVLAVGVGAVVVAPIVSPAVGKVTRPLLKSAIKGGLVFYERAKVVGAEAMETIEDLAAEARAELAREQSTPQGQAGGGGGRGS